MTMTNETSEGGLSIRDDASREKAAVADPPPRAVRDKNPAYVVRLWRGNVPLPVTYWAWGVLVYLLLRILILVVVITTGSVTMVRGLGLFYIVFYLFMCVAIWRSAGQYTGRRVWADLARFSLLLPIIVGITNILVAE